MKKKKIVYMIAVVLALVIINCIPLISFTSKGMRQYDVSGVRLYCLPEDKEHGQQLITQILERRESLAATLSGTDIEGIDVVVYTSHTSLHINTFGLIGYFLPDWYIGKNTKNRVLITSPAHPGPVHSADSVSKAAVHEYVHVLTDRINRDIGYWLKEGLALYLAQQVPSAEDVLEYSQGVQYDDFTTHNPFTFANYGGYSMAYSYIEYLETVYGWEQVVNLIQKGSSYESVLGISEKDTFVKWKEWVRRREG